MKPIFTFLLLLSFFRVFATPTPFAAPTTPATAVVLSNAEGDRFTINWTNGNGAKRIVVLRKDAPVSAAPQDGVDYNASSVFGNGNEMAAGEFVVANTTNNSVVVTGLQAAASYHVAVFEYNGAGSGIQYLATPARGNGNTASAPTGQVLNPQADNITGHSMRLSWTTAGVQNLGSGRLVLAREGAPVNVNPINLASYSFSTTFGSGTQIGSANYVVFRGNGTQVNVDGLKPGVTYYFAVFEYNGSSGSVYNINNPPTASAATLPRPSQAATAISFLNVEGNSMTLNITAGNGAKRLVLAKANGSIVGKPQDGSSYTANNIYGAGQQLPTGEYVVYDGASNFVSLAGLLPATTYSFAVFEYDGSGAGTAYLTSTYFSTTQATVAAPTQQASALAVSNVSSSSFTLNWTPGNGTKRLVLVKAGNTAPPLPVDLTAYGGSSTYGSGNQIGTGTYAVYNGNGSSVTVTNLSGGATYTAAVYEFNGSTAPVYLTANASTVTATTSAAPTSASTALFFNSVDGNRMALGWNLGNGAKRIVVAKAGSPVTALPVDGASYTANSVFGSGQAIAPNEYVVYNSNSGAVNVTNLAANTVYYFAIFEYNTVNNVNYYLTSQVLTGNQSTSTTPTVNASSLAFSTVTGNAMRLTFTKGSGSSRIVVAKAGSEVDAVPTDFTAYPNQPTFGNGTQLGSGNYVVMNSTGNTVTVQGLQPDVTYYFKVFEFNGTSYPVYQTVNVLSGSQATASRPSVSASGMNFYGIEGNTMNVRWTVGNGARRIVVGRAGAPVQGVPVDGVVYAANSAFGSGPQLGAGEFVLSDNSANETSVTNLQPGTTYYFTVFEYDGSGSNIRYQTIAPLSGNSGTLGAPAQQSSNLLFSAAGSSTVTVNWTPGSGDRHLLVIRKGQPVDATLQNLRMYNASANAFASSTLVSGQNYALYNSSASNVNVAGLTPGTTYYFAVYDFNGFSGPVYNMTNPATGTITTLGPPTDAAANVQITSVGSGGTSVRIGWTPGSGQKRLVLIKQGSPVDAMPLNNTAYTANTFYGSGDQLGTGNYAVYTGNGDNVTISNLPKGPVYYVAVFEYNQFATGPQYLTASYAQGQVNSLVLPVKLASFTGVAKESSNLLQWLTAQEMASKEFVIERSADGRLFEAIGSVAAAGNSASNKAYSFEDRNRSPVSYYRLKLIDAAGQTSNSQVIRLQATRDEKMKLYPTLVTSTVQLSVSIATKSTVVMRVIDASGRVVMQQQNVLEAGNNSVTINADRLTPGTYWMQVQAGEKVMTEKFVKE